MYLLCRCSQWMVKQPPYTISQTARSPWKLLQLRKRLNSWKRGSAKKRKKNKKTTTLQDKRSETDRRATVLTWQNDRPGTAIIRFPSKRKLPRVGYKTGHLWGQMQPQCELIQQEPWQGANIPEFKVKRATPRSSGSADDGPEFRGRQGFTHTTCPLS